MGKPYCEQLEDAKAIADTPSLYTWLQSKAKYYDLKYLLAHADDGVIWGRFDQDSNLTTPRRPEELFPECKFPELRAHTFQQCRAFGEKAEVMLWKVGQDWKARLIKDDNKPECLPDEHQILWGTQKEGENKGFTLVSDGQQGLRHAVPLTGISFKNNERPLRLTVRHYIDYDDTGLARIYLSRLVDLMKTNEEIQL